MRSVDIKRFLLLSTFNFVLIKSDEPETYELEDNAVYNKDETYKSRGSKDTDSNISDVVQSGNIRDVSSSTYYLRFYCLIIKFTVAE